MRRFARVRRFIRWASRSRSLCVTPEGLRFVLLAFAIGMAAINTGHNLLYLLLAMMLSLIVLSGVLSELCLKGLVIRRRLPEHVYANKPAAATFSVTNRKARVPSFSLRVMDMVDGEAVDRGVRVPHLSPKTTSVQAYPLLLPRRGRHRMDGVKLLTRFPFGLFVKAATLSLPSEVVVYPEPRPLPESLVGCLSELGHDQALQQRGHGEALYNLRPYHSGDDSRMIHWKTSARRATLIVRESEAEDHRRVTLALSTTMPSAVDIRDHGPLPPEHPFERAVVLMASLATWFHERGYAVGAFVGGQDLGQEAGVAQLHRILRVLALCAPAPVAEASLALQGCRALGDRTARGECTLLVLPWPDPRAEAACGAVSRVIRVSDLS